MNLTKAYLDQFSQNSVDQYNLLLHVLRRSELLFHFLQIPGFQLIPWQSSICGSLHLSQVIHDLLHDEHVLVVSYRDFHLLRWCRSRCSFPISVFIIVSIIVSTFRARATRRRRIARTGSGRGRRDYVHTVSRSRCIVVLVVIFIGVDLHIVLLDMNDRLTEESIGFSNESGRDL